MEEVVEVPVEEVETKLLDNRNESLPYAETDIVTLSANEVEFKLPIAAVRYSKTLRELVVDAGINNVIPLDMDPTHLKPLVDFMIHYAENPPAEDKHTYSGEDREVIETKLTDFDKEWVGYGGDWTQEHFDKLAYYMIAADYLDAIEILDVIAQTMADKTLDKTQEEIKILFHIKEGEGPTPEETKEIEAKYAFLKNE